MAIETQLVEVTIQYLVTRDRYDNYTAEPTTPAGAIDPVEQAIEIAIDNAGDWERE